MPKIGVDLIATKVVKNNPRRLKEAVAFSIGQTYDSPLRQFAARDIADSAMRSTVQSFGQNVYVNYRNTDAPHSVPDSVVVFTTSVDFGTIDIIYDFATNERGLTDYFSKQPTAFLEKVDSRTYYRRAKSSLVY